MFFVAGSNWQLGVGLFILADVGYGASLIVYYPFLPDIAKMNGTRYLRAGGRSATSAAGLRWPCNWFST
jgi:MFS-type transporter involved in bile tolerance (Atg22 family)